MTNIDVEAVDSVDEEGDDDHVHDATDGATGAADGDAIEVEIGPIEDSDTDLPVGVDAPEYVLYGGKGGVGKTTMAAATALASAADGTATLVVSTDPAHSLSDTLEVDVPPRPTQVRDDVPLYAAEIDPEAVAQGPFAGGEFDPGFGAADADGGPTGAAAGPGGVSGSDENPFTGGAGDDPMGMGGLGDLFGGESPLSGPMPGADEAAAMQQLIEYLDDPRFERVVVDTAPTGHTLRLLELPEVMDSMAGRLLKMREQFSGLMDGLKGMFGGGSEPERPMAQLEELAERVERLRTVLRDPTKTDFRVVMVPEKMSVLESGRLIRRLDEFGIPVQTVVVNQVMENLTEVTTEVDPEWVVSPDLDGCEFCQRRWKVQQGALSEAMEIFRGHDVKRVPLLADEVQGEAALRVVAACLQ
ncbi:ArsA family ATPase [Salinigranum halophilum]|uniref:ArsA family ATPase n=1 Tax=Salinigranum halophilum TaxID=2565931 RepID=UPI00115CEF15|nr:TRC40/GET3/ArsA family transport-energizing ATPase [Salinigranum halophilum]